MAIEYLRMVHETDLAYKQTFSKMEERAWGNLFYNIDNPTHYDANHVHMTEQPHPDQMESIIQESIRFYHEKELIPRLYLYQQHDGENAFIEALKQHQFRVEMLNSPVQLWKNSFAQIEPAKDVEIELVNTENYEDALRVESIPEFGGRDVREKAFSLEFHHPAFHHFLLKWKGVPASTACMFQCGDIVRIESVATRKEFRGQGLVGHLLLHIQQEYIKLNAKQLCVFPINQQVEKVYQRYGFETVGQITLAHAFLGGRGIFDIR